MIQLEVYTPAVHVTYSNHKTGDLWETFYSSSHKSLRIADYIMKLYVYQRGLDNDLIM